MTATVAQLRHEARAALEAGPYTVVNKEATPPSGDKHDYMSLAPYWWPNPQSADGMPYVRRDGERNPDIYNVRDRMQLGEMVDTVETLALAYYFTGDEEFAARAGLLIRTWFLDRATRMNPHLEYGQAIPGVNTGRGAGLIETRALTRIVDSVGLLADSDAWTDADQLALQEWFEKFLTWMLTSENGREEAGADNNRVALDFLAPFGIEERAWPYQQINGFAPELIYPLLRVAAEKYPDAPYGELLKKLPSFEPDSRGVLLVSPLESISKLHVK